MSDHLHETAEIKRLERPNDRVLAGVCSGLGRYFDLNASFFRLGFVVLTLLGGAGIFVYLAAVLVVPDEGKERSIAEQVIAERHRRPWPLVALAVVCAILVIGISRNRIWPTFGAGWVLVAGALLVVFWAGRSGTGVGHSFWRGVGRIVAGLAALFVACVVAAVVLAFTWFHLSLSDGVGTRTYTPANASQVHRTYNLGAGHLTIDLSELTGLAQPVTVTAHLGLGKLQVVVPRGVPVTVDGHANAGDVSIFNQRVGGRDVDLQTGSGHVLTIDARVGAGRIDVEHASP
jgi:phage shock protein C